MSDAPPVAGPPPRAAAGGRRRLGWRVVLIVGVALSVALTFVGFVLDRNEVGVKDPLTLASVPLLMERERRREGAGA